MSTPFDCKHPKVGRLGAFTTVVCPDCKKSWTPEEFKAFLHPPKMKKAQKPESTDTPTTENKEDIAHE